MPQYFFDIRDNQGTHRDDTGLELPNIETAMDEARRALADMNRDALAFGGDQVLEIVIRDHGDGPVRLSLSITTEKLNGREQ